MGRFTYCMVFMFELTGVTHECEMQIFHMDMSIGASDQYRFTDRTCVNSNQWAHSNDRVDIRDVKQHLTGLKREYLSRIPICPAGKHCMLSRPHEFAAVHRACGPFGVTHTPVKGVDAFQFAKVPQLEGMIKGLATCKELMQGGILV